jgi:hypothetical protein
MPAVSSRSSSCTRWRTAGLLIQFASAPVALLADAASFLMSGALIARVRRAESRAGARTEARRIRDLVREIVEGMRYVFGQPYVRAIALTTTTRTSSAALLAGRPESRSTPPPRWF